MDSGCLSRRPVSFQGSAVAVTAPGPMVANDVPSMVNRGWDGVRAVSLRCRSWGCPNCHDDRTKQLIALALSGAPTTFITLTVNPAWGASKADRARRLVDSWRTIVKLVKKRYGYSTLPYFCVFEATKAGEPHLHILARVKYIDQKWLSKQMKLLMNAPIVDIRRVKNKNKLAFYVSKYCGKEPHRFATCKRYWTTRDWEVRLAAWSTPGAPSLSS